MVTGAGDLSAFEDGSVDEIRAIHLIEHLSEIDAYHALHEWYRALKPGGTLWVECPNYIKVFQHLLSQKPNTPHWRRYWTGLWGTVYEGKTTPAGRILSSGCAHKWLYCPESLSEIVKEAGFTDIVILGPSCHRQDRDMRLNAIKPEE